MVVKKKKKSLIKKTTRLEKEIDQLTNKWKRALADYQNLEKRIEQEKKQFVKFSTAALIDKLLPVLDSLEKAGEHLKDDGLEMALEQFKEVLKIEGVEEIKVQGKKFDPLLMDCQEVVKGKKDQVIKVVQKGYLLNKKVLRPAKVMVGRDEKGGK